MRKATIVFMLSIGFLFIFFSFQDDNFKEYFYEKEMERTYEIKELNEMHKGIPTKQTFAGKTIETTHEFLDGPAFSGKYDNTIRLGNIKITVDGEEIAALESFPIEVMKSELKTESLNQYGSFVSYWHIVNKKTEKASFAIVLQSTREIVKPNMDGYIPIEDQDYQIITVDESGTVETEAFAFKDRSKLQTQLLPSMDAWGVGHYVDIASSFPLLFFFPIITFFIGILIVLGILVLLFFRYKKISFNFQQFGVNKNTILIASIAFSALAILIFVKGFFTAYGQLVGGISEVISIILMAIYLKLHFSFRWFTAFLIFIGLLIISQIILAVLMFIFYYILPQYTENPNFFN